MQTGIGASELAYTFRSTKVYIRVFKHLGLHTGIGAPGPAYRYRSTLVAYEYMSIWACIQVKEHPGLYTGVGALKLAYNMSNSTFIQLSFNFVHKWAREPAKGNQRVYVGATVQMLAYRYIHMQVQRYKCLHTDIYTPTFDDWYAPKQIYAHQHSTIGMP